MQNEKNPVDTVIERRARLPFKRRPEILKRAVRDRPTGSGAGVDRGNDRKALPRRLLQEPVRWRAIAELAQHGLAFNHIETRPRRGLIDERMRLVKKSGSEDPGLHGSAQAAAGQVAA